MLYLRKFEGIDVGGNSQPATFESADAGRKNCFLDWAENGGPRVAVGH